MSNGWLFQQYLSTFLQEEENVLSVLYTEDQELWKSQISWSLTPSSAIYTHATLNVGLNLPEC